MPFKIGAGFIVLLCAVVAVLGVQALFDETPPEPSGVYTGPIAASTPRPAPTRTPRPSRRATLAACRAERAVFLVVAPARGTQEVTPATMSAGRPGWCVFAGYPAAALVQVQALRAGPCRFRVTVEEGWPEKAAVPLVRHETCRSLGL